jgi:hypothetical protein
MYSTLLFPSLLYSMPRYGGVEPLMNLIDCYVSKILGKPYRRFGAWWVDVEYQAYGCTSKTQLMFRTEQGALAATVGHHFLA